MFYRFDDNADTERVEVSTWTEWGFDQRWQGATVTDPEVTAFQVEGVSC